MVRRGTILDATIWTTEPRPPFRPRRRGLRQEAATTGSAARSRARHIAQACRSTHGPHFADWMDAWPDLVHELATLPAKVKMPNAAVLRSVTLIAARAVGQQRDLGSIEPGKLANIVVLSRNPLADLEISKRSK
jgi:hypothetical protein